jgi:hypothetical protein
VHQPGIGREGAMDDDQNADDDVVNFIYSSRTFVKRMWCMHLAIAVVPVAS